MNSIVSLPAVPAGAYIYDCVGVGFGPSNIALAVALGERSLLGNCLFLEKKLDFLWHPGMLIPGSDIQHNPLRDFVTPRDPCSPLGFLSYLKVHQRLFDYLNLAAHYPPRTEYARYIKWVADHYRNFVRLGTGVSQIRPARCVNGTPLVEIVTDGDDLFYARTLSFGTGRSPYIPATFAHLVGDDVVHLTDYLFAKERWHNRLANPHIAVIGGSQSAIEIALDLLNTAKVTCISKSFGFKQKDLSAFTEAIYYPEFVDYYFNTTEEGQSEITDELWRSNYGAADHDVIATINTKLYEQKVLHSNNLAVLHNKRIESVVRCLESKCYELLLVDKYSGDHDSITVDGIVLATGFRNFGRKEHQEPYHPLLAELAQNATFRSDGSVAVDRDYQMVTLNSVSAPPVFLNGLCESTHGFGDAGSFSLLSVRSDQIATALASYLKLSSTKSLENMET